ncbi:MAG TPA: invasion associated locus B family protein [Paracoccaceae bacterium]|nr:invasion associated locus B family protein [Paracoccaceae bacterium]
MSMQLARAAGLAAAVAVGIGIAGTAAAQNERVAVHTDWTVFTPSDPRECYIASPPTASVARRGGEVVQVDRGEILLFVSFRPQENVENEVSFTSGYPFREGSTVTVEVNGQTFTMQTGTGEGNRWAWTASPEEDARLVAAFRGGAEAKITGTSSRGTTTEDTFSLMGFTAALGDAAGRCS